MSKTVIWLLLCLCLLSVYQVSSIICYECFSVKSWQHCNQNARIRNCSHYVGLDFNACVQQYVEIPPQTKNDSKISRYGRRCGKKQRCLNLEKTGCNGFCKIRCCDTDRCNSASTWGLHFASIVVSMLYSLNTYLYLT